MGWLCPRCNSENKFGVSRCQACGKRTGGLYRLLQRGHTLKERRRADKFDLFVIKPTQMRAKDMARVNRLTLVWAIVVMLCGVATEHEGIKDLWDYGSNSRAMQRIQYTVTSVAAQYDQAEQKLWMKAGDIAHQRQAAPFYFGRNVQGMQRELSSLSPKDISYTVRTQWRDGTQRAERNANELSRAFSNRMTWARLYWTRVQRELAMKWKEVQ